MGKILVIADEGDSCAATPRGLELAAKLGLDVVVAAFTYTPLKALKASAAEQDRVRRRLLDEREKVVRA
ncbi:MAG: universal stress protein, partial [Halioglobus sp.]|nr:universal stress protein [Halioglobus sp.]